MGTVPVLRTWTTGEVVDEIEFNANVRDPVYFLLSPPRAVVTVFGATWDIASGNAPGSINTWDTALSNGDNMWNAGQPSRLTANTPGRYELSVYIHFPASSAAATSNFHVGLALNSGGTDWQSANELQEDCRPGVTTTKVGTSCSLIYEQFLNVGDYVEAYAWHNTGATNTIANDPFSCQFSALWVSAS